MVLDKYYKMSKSELINSDFWLSEAYNNATKLFPIFIPSYNRYNHMGVLKLLKSSSINLPVTFVVRESQYDLYKSNSDLDKYEILSVEDDKISNLAAVREYILQYCIEHNIEKYVTIDDDIAIAGFKVPCTTSTGNQSATAFKDDFGKFFSMFCEMSDKCFNLDHNVATTGLKVRGNVFPSSPDIVDSDKFAHVIGNPPRSFVCINMPLYRDSDVHFDAVNGKLVHEDLDSLCQLAIKGYYWCTFEFMFYQDEGASTFGFDNMLERAELQVKTMKNKYSNYDFFSVRDGKLSNGDSTRYPTINIDCRKVRKFIKNNFSEPDKYYKY